MHHLFITILTVCFIILFGCASQEHRLLKERYPESYVEGHHHGCREGEYQSKNNYNQRRAESIKSKQQALIDKILKENEENTHQNSKSIDKEHQTTPMAFKTVVNEDISIDPTSTYLLDSPSVGTQTTSIDKPSKLKVLATVSDYMHNNAHKNTDWSETDFQYEKGWSDAFFECNPITAAKANIAVPKRKPQIKGYEAYNYNNNWYKDYFNQLENDRQLMKIYEKMEKAKQQQEWQKQQNLESQRLIMQPTPAFELGLPAISQPSTTNNQLMRQQRRWQQQNPIFQRTLEPPKPRIEQGRPAIARPLFDNNQLLRQQRGWQQQNPIFQRRLEQPKPRFEQGRPAIARPLIDSNQLLRQLQNPKIQRIPEKPVIQQLPNNYNRLLQQPKAIVQQPRLQIESNTPPQLRINRNNPYINR
ncbi:MAG: hypothetical protein V3U88_00580 [Methylococcales bacterium]